MKIRYHIITLLLLITYTSKSKGQIEEYQKDYFRSPLDIPSLLSANFGELRTDHFHAGIDFKTQGKIGHKLYACADGYISRIKITSAGYGKTIYINHPNGLTTVYGHMDEFNLQIENYTRQGQYSKQSYEINIFPEAKELPVLKGDVIGLSGNSGYSFGPHLHFEIRKTANNYPINPLFFDFGVVDNVHPKIFSLVVYPQNNSGIIEGSKQKTRYLTRKKNGIYQLSKKDTLEAFGILGFAIEANDYFNNSHNKCGIYKSTLLVDNEKIFSKKIDGFSFAETRYINSHMDYELNMKKKKKIHKSFIEPNNKLSIYEYVKESGLINFTDTLVHHVKYIVEDVNKNQSILEFFIKSNPNIENSPNEINHFDVIQFEEAYKLDTGQFNLSIPANALYDSLLFEFSIDSVSEFLSPIYHVHNMYTPIHKKYSMNFKIDTASLKLNYNKLTICTFNNKNDVISIGGEYKEGVLSAESRYFGAYFISIDTVKPEIIPEKFVADSNLSALSQISFIIKDELSGIKTYNGYIDDQWVLFEYDFKNDRITYRIDDKMRNQEDHYIHIFIEDNCGNIQEFESNFKWRRSGT